jgi:hypothetical protein
MASSSRACPPQAEYWCSRLARRPNVSLIWHANQIAKTGSNLGSPTIRSYPAHWPPDPKSLMACSLKSRPSRFAAALRAGLDLTCARHRHSSMVGTKSWRTIEQRADNLLDILNPHVSNPGPRARPWIFVAALLAMTKIELSQTITPYGSRRSPGRQWRLQRDYRLTSSPSHMPGQAGRRPRRRRSWRGSCNSPTDICSPLAS